MEAVIKNINWNDIAWHKGDKRIRLDLAHMQGGGTIAIERKWHKQAWRRKLQDFIVYASGKSNYYISKLLNQFYNATSYSFPGTLYFALWTATLSASSTGSTAGETPYTSYTRVAVTANTANFSTSSSGGSITNDQPITWPANTGSASTITYIMITDASTTGDSLYWGSITSTTINAGDTPQINTSSLTSTEA